MTDDTKLRGGQDRSRISLNQQHEVRYWTETLGVSEEQLRELVQKHGNSADKIREALGKAA
jgi:hypothetical protein